MIKPELCVLLPRCVQ